MEQKLGPLQALARFWGTLNTTQRFVTAAFLSLSIVLLGVVTMIAAKPRMEVLFSGLQGTDSGAIVAKLQENKVPYEIEGSVIKVPQKYVHEMRMQLASQGLPQGGTVGFEIFDKGNLGMTEFSQRVSYQRAVQGELARTIGQLDGVEASRVHVAIPEPSVFSDSEKQATASVVVKLRPGCRLGSDQVGGIVHLVSSAVEGLKPNEVTVVDTNGNMLSEAGDEATGLDPRMSASKLKLKREVESQMEKDIESMLERVVGPNKAVVRVNAKINFDRRETSSETYSPAGTNTGVLTSEQKLQESYGSGSGTAGGNVGIASVLRQGAPTSSPAGKGAYERVETTNKYEVSKTTERVVKAPGEIEQLSVAVMVDGTVDGAKIATIKNAVSAACGIDATRKDQIIVESIQFDNKAAQDEAKEMASLAAKSGYMSSAKTVGAVLLLLVFLFFLKNTLKQVNISIAPQPTVLQDFATPGGVAGVSAQAFDPAGDGGRTKPATGEVPPEEVAQVLRKWMSES
jgi:flagellar M-ring protein FliF